MKLPEMTQQLLKAPDAVAFADLLRRSWFGYGVSELTGSTFTVEFGTDKDVTPRTFYEAMAFLKFQGTTEDSARIYHLGRAPYRVRAALARDVMTVSVDEAESLPTVKEVAEFLEAYAAWSA